MCPLQMGQITEQTHKTPQGVFKKSFNQTRGYGTVGK